MKHGYAIMEKDPGFIDSGSAIVSRKVKPGSYPMSYRIEAIAAAALILASCASLFPPVAGDTRSQEQIAFDDACWSVKTAEATFVAFNARGAIDAAGVASFQKVAASLDAACSGPIPTDMKQFVSQALIGTASIVSLVAFQPKS